MDHQMQTYLRGQKTDMRALKEQTQLQNKIQMHALKVAVDTNKELKSINGTLNALGFVMEDVSGSLQRTEAMHKKHYDAVEKEKALKEILYNFKKFHESTAKSGDPVVGAASARILSQVIHHTDFGTKDLSNIADKEYFDERMNEARSLSAKLGAAEQTALDEFEYAYGAYGYLKGYDLEKENPFVSKVAKPNIPGQLSAFDPLKFPELLELAELDKQVTPWKIAAAAAVVVPMIVLGATLGSSVVGAGLLIGLIFGAPIWFIKVEKIAGRIKQLKNSAIPPAHRGQTMKYLAGALAPLKSYTDQISGEKEIYDREFAELSTGLEAKRRALASTINSYIKAHPGLAEFYPSVE